MIRRTVNGLEGSAGLLRKVVWNEHTVGTFRSCWLVSPRSDMRCSASACSRYIGNTHIRYSRNFGALALWQQECLSDWGELHVLIASLGNKPCQPSCLVEAVPTRHC